jgi:thiol-disulfide isomerase/thioredoxin
MTTPDPADAALPSATGSRQRRTGALLLLIALVAGAALLRHVVGGTGDEAPLRFVVQAEPRRLPPLAFIDAEGKATRLDAWRGKVVLLNIWATWCGPCRREMPSLDRLQAQLGSEGLAVVALSIDKGASALPAIKAFYADLGIRQLGVYNDPEGDAGFELGSPGIPVTLLLDRDGREIGRLTGPAEWDGAEALALIRRHLAARAP